MKLKSIKIKNFRGYFHLVEIPFNNMTAFIGKNDAGKSTVLEALEIFFNNKLINCEANDLNKDAEKLGESVIEISCIFNDLPEKLVLDSTNETNLENEYLLNENGDLEIKKTFDVSYNKPKENNFIVCNHPTAENYDDLLLVKNAELQKRAKKIKDEKDALPFTANAPLRKLIWESASSLDIKLIDLEVGKEDSKNIYSKLQEYMPLYALFQSDRDNSDENKEVTDPMKIAIQDALKNVESEIESIKNEVKRRAVRAAEETLEKLKEMDPNIAESLSVEFKAEPKFDSAFKLSINSDNGISINKRGSGVRRLILLNFFRAEVDRRKNNKNTSVIYAFEEPETSQHPNNQEMIIKTFLELSELDNTQIIITTHTPNLAKSLPLESLRYVTKDDEGHKVVKHSQNDIYKEISESLGIIPYNLNHKTRCVFLVEGHYDVSVYHDISVKLKNGGYIEYDFDDKNIQVIFSGGCGTLEFWVNSEFAKSLNVPIVAYFDSDKLDKSDSTTTMEKINKLQSSGLIKLGFCTYKRELENYLHSDLFKDFDGTYEVKDFNDIKEEVNSIIKSVGKTKVLEKFWPKMTAEYIRNREEYIGDDGKIHFEFSENFSKIYNIL